MLPKFLIPGLARSFIKFDEPTDGGGTGTPSEPSAADGKSVSDAGDESSKKSQSVPYERFAEVNEALKAYKQFGDPAEILDLVKDYTRLVEEKAASKEKPSSSKDSRIPADKRAQILADLEEVLPGVSRIPELLEKVGKVEESTKELSATQVARLQAQASELVKRLVSDEGYDPKISRRVEELVATEVYSDRKLSRAFYSGDLSAVEKAFAAVKSDFLDTHVAKPLKADHKAKVPGMMQSGRSSTEKEAPPLSEAELKKLSPQEQRKAIGKDAFAFYEKLVAENQAAKNE